MSHSESLTQYVRALATLRGLAIDDDWLPAVELHLKRLLDATELIEKSPLTSQDLAARFEP